MQDPSGICDLHHSSWQCRILNPLSEVWDRTCNLMVPSQICFHCAKTGTLWIFLRVFFVSFISLPHRRLIYAWVTFAPFFFSFLFFFCSELAKFILCLNKTVGKLNFYASIGNYFLNEFGSKFTHLVILDCSDDLITCFWICAVLNILN